MTSIYPALRFHDARAAIRWLADVFGFAEKDVFEQDGVIGHAELRFGDDLIMLGAERDGPFGGRAGKASTYLAVDDAHAAWERAQAAGADVVAPLRDKGYGSDFTVADPEGNLWSCGDYRPA